MSSPEREEQTKKFCELLHEAINDESKAQQMYQNILGTWKDYLPMEDTLAREVLISIIREEGTHEALLKTIQVLKCPIK